LTAELIARWRACPLDAPPYRLPGDEVLAERWTHPYHTFNQFIESPSFGVPDHRLHLGLLPAPYVGDLERASIYILLLNPGFSPDDYYGESHSPEYRETLVRNLRQQDGDSAYPFLFLNPRFSWHGGFAYWHRRLGGIVAELVRQQGLTTQAALSKLARATCALELLPYHSASFRMPPAVMNQLASVRLVREFVHQVLVPRAERKEALIIVTRGAKQWGISKSENIVVYEGGETRGAHLSLNTSGGTAIAGHLGLA
jgi:hypothetical protein